MSEQGKAILIGRDALEEALHQQGAAFQNSITERHAHLFAAVPLFISAADFAQMREVIAAVEQVVSLPAWSALQHGDRCKGVFFGYDFHLNDSGAHLIEINSNAGGALLNELLLRSQAGQAWPGSSTADAALAHDIVGMFRNEWRIERGETALQTVLIVDEQPDGQYLYPEFILAQQMFARAGIKAFIADPADLEVRSNGVYLDGCRIDLIYNRLTDFSLAAYPALLGAYADRHVVLTPSPEAYMRYADKRNLARLTDGGALLAAGAATDIIEVLQKGIPQTRVISHGDDAEAWWDVRKQWFFKPVSGYGAKGAYRGDKLTKRVFGEIMAGDYVAQKLAPPGELAVSVDGTESLFKYDVRCYVYDGRIQLVCARMYQGQTTNFRTPGGGFAVVRVL